MDLRFLLSCVRGQSIQQPWHLANGRRVNRLCLPQPSITFMRRRCHQVRGSPQTKQAPLNCFTSTTSSYEDTDPFHLHSLLPTFPQFTVILSVLCIPFCSNQFFPPLFLLTFRNGLGWVGVCVHARSIVGPFIWGRSLCFCWTATHFLPVLTSHPSTAFPTPSRAHHRPTSARLSQQPSFDALKGVGPWRRAAQLMMIAASARGFLLG